MEYKQDEWMRGPSVKEVKVKAFSVTNLPWNLLEKTKIKEK